MKSFLYSLCAALALGCGQAQTQVPQTDLEKMNLKGKVHTVELKSYNDPSLAFSAPGRNAEGTLDLYMVFNEAGNLTEKKESDGTDEAHAYTYMYDAKGNPVKITAIHNYSGQTTHTLITEWTYDASGKKIEGSILSLSNGPEKTDSTRTRDEFMYNENGQLILVDHIEKGFPKSTNRYTYHSNGQIQSNTYESPMFSYKYIILYDEKGRIVEQEMISSRYTNRSRFTYNAQGDKETITRTTPPLTYKCTYEYDPQGNWVLQQQETDAADAPQKEYFLARRITYR